MASKLATTTWYSITPKRALATSRFLIKLFGKEGINIQQNIEDIVKKKGQFLKLSKNLRKRLLTDHAPHPSPPLEVALERLGVGQLGHTQQNDEVNEYLTLSTSSTNL